MSVTIGDHRDYSRSGGFATILAISVLVADFTFAQDSDVSSIEEIVVTASKRGTDQSRSGRIGKTMITALAMRLPFFATSVVAMCGLLAASANAQTVGHGSDFTGTYEFVGPLLAIGPCDGHINGKWETRCTNYPYNENGRQATIAAVDDGSVDCVPDGLARLNMRTLYAIQIWHESRSVKIKYQFGDIVRTIRLDRESVPDGTPATAHGYSVGKWMGDTLYVETTHLEPSFFAPGGGGRIGGPMSEQARIVERWWPSPNEGNLLMDMVLDDPVNYDRTFLLHRREWSTTDLGELEPWNCVPASELLLEDDPDLDKFFENPN